MFLSGSGIKQLNFSSIKHEGLKRKLHGVFFVYLILTLDYSIDESIKTAGDPSSIHMLNLFYESSTLDC